MTGPSIATPSPCPGGTSAEERGTSAGEQGSSASLSGSLCSRDDSEAGAATGSTSSASINANRSEARSSRLPFSVVTPFPKSSRLQSMRKNPADTLADVTLIADGTEVRAHRSVLCTYDFFRHALGPGASFSEAQSGVFRMQDMSSEALNAVVDFVYDCAPLSWCPVSVLLEVWSFAHMGLCEDITQATREALLDKMGKMPRDAVIDVLRVATLLGDEAMVLECSRVFFSKKERKQSLVAMRAVLAPVLKELDIDEMKSLGSYIETDKGVDAEGVWTMICLEWVMVDVAEREKHGCEVLGRVVIDSLSGRMLTELGEHALELRRASGSRIMSSIEETIHEAVFKKMRKLDSEIEMVGRSDVGRLADLMHFDERKPRSRCSIM